jgi:Fe-S-cluster containining protein
MSSIFNCTQCGKCCHDLNVPLSSKEALQWIERGGRVRVLTEAIPWTEDSLLSKEVLNRKKAITFAAQSGQLQLRVSVTWVAVFQGGCPNLDASHNCTIYSERPQACRIYPFELNPQMNLSPADKLCPDDAWTLSEPREHQAPSQIHIPLTDAKTQEAIDALNRANRDEVLLKRRVCQQLGIRAAALSNDGYLFHHTHQGSLQVALRDEVSKGTQSSNPAPELNEEEADWLIYTQKAQTQEALIGLNAKSGVASEIKDQELEFIDL